MASVLWISLRPDWKLEEVQAGLQVCIALLCTWGIFAFSRFCWQLSSNLIRKNRAVALASLMSINTIGEAFDVVALLKRRIFRQRYWKLLAQSIVVVSLTASTIVSGPIAKASTRYGTEIKQISVPGYLATRDFNSRVYANVDWNLTYTALERASFPTNQLLDFIPHTNATWLYRDNEWNNSWTMDCKKTEITPIAVVDSGICGNLSVELPATNKFFGYDDYDYWYTSWNGLFGNSTWLQDGMIVLVGWNYGIDLTANSRFSNMSVIIASLHVHSMAKKASNDTSKCNFGKGPAGQASYSKMECSLKRPQSVPDENQIAYPDSVDWFAVPQSYTSNYYDRMVTEANTNQNITMLGPDDLIRFYQTYIITKDYQYRRQVWRLITAEVQVVQLSSTFIAFGGLYALLVILGLFNYGVFAYKNRATIRDTPESKLDWIVQSILDESETPRPPIHRMSSGRKGVIAQTSHPGIITRASEKVRAAFENARYGSANEEEQVPLADNGAPQAGSTYDQTGGPGYGVNVTEPSPFTGYSAYTGYTAEPTAYYNMNGFEAGYATQHTEYDPTRGQPQPLQNPQSIFTADRWRGYQKLS